MPRTSAPRVAEEDHHLANEARTRSSSARSGTRRRGGAARRPCSAAGRHGPPSAAPRGALTIGRAPRRTRAVLRRRAAGRRPPAPASPVAVAPAAPRPGRRPAGPTAGPAATRRRRRARRLAGRDAAVADAPGTLIPGPAGARRVGHPPRRAVRQAGPHPRVARRRRPDDERGTVERAHTA